MKKNIIGEMKQLGWVVGVFLILYFTGLHTEVAAFAQRMVLYTGLITAETPPPNTDAVVLDDADLNVKLKSLDGQLTELNDYKGKVIFMNLWATWCAPCIAEMPGIQGLYDKLQAENNEDIVFVMLSIDSSEKKAKKFIEKKGFSFPVYTAISDLPEVFKVASIPTTFVISPDGKIVTKKVGMANYNKRKFKSYLEELAQ